MSDMKDTNKQTTPVVKITLPNFEEDKKKERKGLPPWLLGGKDASGSVAGAGLRGGGSAAQQGFWGRLLSMFGKGGRGLGAGEAAAGAGTRGGFFARLFSMFGKGGAGFGGAGGLGGGSLAAGGLLGGKMAAMAAMALIAAGIIGAGLYFAKGGFGKDDDAVGRSGLTNLAARSAYVPEVDRKMPNRSSLQMLSDRNSAADSESNRNRSVKDDEMPSDVGENISQENGGGAGGANGGNNGRLGGIPKLGDVLSGSKYSYAGGGSGGSGSTGFGGGLSGGTVGGNRGSGSRGVLTGGDSGATPLSGASGLSSSNAASRFSRATGIGVGRRFATEAGGRGTTRPSGTAAFSQVAAVRGNLGTIDTSNDEGDDVKDAADDAWGSPADNTNLKVTPTPIPSAGTSGDNPANANLNTNTTPGLPTITPEFNPGGNPDIDGGFPELDISVPDPSSIEQDVLDNPNGQELVTRASILTYVAMGVLLALAVFSMIKNPIGMLVCFAVLATVLVLMGGLVGEMNDNGQPNMAAAMTNIITTVIASSLVVALSGFFAPFALTAVLLAGGFMASVSSLNKLVDIKDGGASASAIESATGGSVESNSNTDADSKVNRLNDNSIEIIDSSGTKNTISYRL